MPTFDIGKRVPTDIEIALLEQVGLKVKGNSFWGFQLQYSDNSENFTTEDSVLKYYGQNIVTLTDNDFTIDLDGLCKAVVIQRYKNFKNKITEVEKELQKAKIVLSANSMNSDGQSLDDEKVTLDLANQSLDPLINCRDNDSTMFNFYINELVVSNKAIGAINKKQNLNSSPADILRNAGLLNNRALA